MEAPDPFDGTQAHKLRGFIQSFQLIFHNYPANLFSDRKKVMYSNSFLTCRAGKWIAPYLSNISNGDPSYLLNNWQLFETQLFTRLGDPNEIQINPLPSSSPIIPNSPKGEDLILGYDSLYRFAPIIDWKNGLITYDSEHKDSGGIKSSASNSLLTSVNSVGMVGVLKTHSLPYSVHIPSIMPSQSLLQSRDEAFKEIKDVGEVVAISSLHLFEGEMDLPPSSFHASLEEHWDEEEDPKQITTVLKVLPPSYHQYLDVFSKVKAEKLPPHCAYDHHIKLEGLLPPVGVIYSLSNKDSETLQAYIS
ncbi:hypothetical protein O181_013078 [Austropuccinia psidii MF-1]|uniref:Uncharacterized protein n=1 Tax=Austropuccinia psidii MF-1 TaxID=1389203 RepID=A0A9Q3GMS4_9BASI|nr:hypothetical protein [Austropuccinia psidii MF-1]